jgi:hypothetical protein
MEQITVIPIPAYKIMLFYATISLFIVAPLAWRLLRRP